jgi:anti-anti-sigma factor
MPNDPTSAPTPEYVSRLEQDLAQRDQQIQQLHEQLLILQALLDQIPDFLYAKDQQLRFVYGNRSVAASFGQDAPEKIIGMCDADIFPPEMATAYGALEYQVIQSGQAELNVEQQVINEHGQQRWVLTSKIPWRNQQGEVTGIIGVARDITERREAEQQLARYNEELELAVSARTADLARSERLFRTLFDRAPLGIAMLEHDLVIQANPAYIKMLGMEADSSLVSHSIFDHIATSAHAKLRELFEQGTEELTDDTTIMRRRDQHEFPALIKITQLALDDGQLRRVLFLSDLTSLHRAEEERLALSQQIIDTQQLALRELSTPLVPIADEVVAMPLVGSIDDRRAQQIMEALLEGIVAQQASFAIIDVTGVRLIDTSAANALVQITQAAKLLGAQVVLTGISAEVSQTLIQIGANLGGMVACPNLQAGIAYVTKQMQAHQ